MIEIAEASKLHIHIDEEAIPIEEDVRGACEILGLDPSYVANEGRFIAFVPASDAERVLTLLGAESRIIGHVEWRAVASYLLNVTPNILKHAFCH